MSQLLIPAQSAIVEDDYARHFAHYLKSPGVQPMFMLGNAQSVLRSLPDESIDFAMTSPPYWGKREYSGGGIGLELEYRDFVRSLAEICAEVKRVLK